jgi:hypothetical protein
VDGASRMAHVYEVLDLVASAASRHHNAMSESGPRTTSTTRLIVAWCDRCVPQGLVGPCRRGSHCCWAAIGLCTSEDAKVLCYTRHACESLLRAVTTMLLLGEGASLLHTSGPAAAAAAAAVPSFL